MQRLYSLGAFNAGQATLQNSVSPRNLMFITLCLDHQEGLVYFTWETKDLNKALWKVLHTNTPTFKKIIGKTSATWKTQIIKTTQQLRCSRKRYFNCVQIGTLYSNKAGVSLARICREEENIAKPWSHLLFTLQFPKLVINCPPVLLPGQIIFL